MMTYFLNTQEEHYVAPTGGGVFSPTGFIAPWKAQILYSFMSATPIDDELVDMKVEKDSGWITYYYTDYERAAEAAKTVSDYGPGSVWHLEALVAEIKNFADEEIREKFGQALVYDIDIKTLGSKKRRHNFHMLALPLLVNAMAKLLGYAEGEGYPGFDVSELVRFGEKPEEFEEKFTDDFQFKMIGDPDASAGDDDHYTNSVLWKRRAALWAALGEDDPRNYNMTGSGTKFDTESERLSNCLAAYSYSWNPPAWARVVPVSDPRVDAVYGDDRKRLNIACVWEIFPNESAAQEAAQADIERLSGDDETASAPTDLAIPLEWATAGLGQSDWIEALTAAKAKVGELPVAPPAKMKALKGVADEVGATVEEVQAWWDQV